MNDKSKRAKIVYSYILTSNCCTTIQFCIDNTKSLSTFVVGVLTYRLGMFQFRNFISKNGAKFIKSI